MSSQKQWTKEEKLRFVQEYVKHQALLVTGCKNETKNRKVLRNNVLIQLSKSMNIPGFGPREAYAKLRNIKSTYAQELKKIRKAAAHGSKYVSNLIWFKTLDKAYKNLKKEDCRICIQANNMDMIASEGNVELDANTSLVESNGDYVKLELMDEEVNADEAVNYLEENSENDNDLPKTRMIHAPHYVGTLNCVNFKSDMNKSDSCDGMPGISNHLMYQKNEFDVFGESIGAQLKNMPLVDALEAQMYIQNYLSNLRLQALRFQNSC